MTITAVGIGGGWSATAPVDEPGAGGTELDLALDAADGVAARALELVLAGEAEFADAATHEAQAAARHAAERRIEQRAKIRELEKKIAEEQANKSFWEKLADAFMYIGAALATVAAVTASVVSFGAASAPSIAAAAATWTAVASAAAAGGAAAGAVTAGSRFGAASCDSNAANLQADVLAGNDAIAATQEQLAQTQTFAQAVVDTEDALRRQALAWLRNEDEARRVAVSVAR
ncbi:MAG: hypothetical protein HY907_22855 [Deltaproteobacteria bacterium]|nr:hypothetical protein [Deltaproteobacteria bacterium]